MSKGDKRRPQKVSDEQMQEAWDLIFAEEKKDSFIEDYEFMMKALEDEDMDTKRRWGLQHGD